MTEKWISSRWPVLGRLLAALRLTAPRIVDPRRAYIIFDQLSFQSEKDEAARIIGGCRH